MLGDLAGYKVRYGLSANSLTQVVDVAGAAVTSASIAQLTVTHCSALPEGGAEGAAAR